MLRIKKRHNIKDQYIIVFNETVVYYMKIDVCLSDSTAKNFIYVSSDCSYFSSKSDEFMLNLSDSQLRNIQN